MPSWKKWMGGKRPKIISQKTAISLLKKLVWSTLPKFL